MRRLGIFSAIFSKDLTFVEIESKEGKMKIPVSGIDELIEILSKKASA
jgi:transcription-repair coupling factor (superfamily II helicase)